MPPLQHFFAEALFVFEQPGAERGDSVVLVVDRLAEQEELPLLGAEQDDEPHHDGESGFVELRGGHVLQ